MNGGMWKPNLKVGLEEVESLSSVSSPSCFMRRTAESVEQGWSALRLPNSLRPSGVERLTQRYVHL